MTPSSPSTSAKPLDPRRPSLAVIVSTYNNPSGLEGTLLSLTRQTVMPARVIIADDGSGPPTRELVDRFRDRLPIEHVWHEDNGFRLAAIRNRAVAASREDYLVFLDGDTVADRRFVEDHAAFARPGRFVLGQRCAVVGFHGRVLPRQPGILELGHLLLSGRVLNDSRAFSTSLSNRIKGFLKGVRAPIARYRACTVNETHGGNMGIWREGVHQINGFDERYVGWGREDRDATERLTRLGLISYQLGFKAICFHIDHPVNVASADNRKLYNSTERPIRCVEGLDQYLRTRHIA